MQLPLSDPPQLPTRPKHRSVCGWRFGCCMECSVSRVADSAFRFARPSVQSAIPAGVLFPALVSAVAWIAIPLFVIVMIQLRQNWARFLYVALVSLPLLIILMSPPRIPGPGATLFKIGILGAGLVPMILLFGGSASRWFYRVRPEEAQRSGVPSKTCTTFIARARPSGRPGIYGIFATILNLVFSLLAATLLTLVALLSFFAFFLGPGQVGKALGIVAALLLFALACYVSVLKSQRARYLGHASARTLLWALLPLPFLFLVLSPLAPTVQGIHWSDVFARVISRSGASPTTSNSHAPAETLHIERQDIATLLAVAPHVIVADRHGGFIVAGQSAGQPGQYSPKDNFEEWALRIDASHTKVWEVQHAKNPVGPTNITAGIGYNGVVVMPDDTTFLCGTQQRDNARKAHLTHLDVNGKLIELKQQPHADDASETDESEFNTCLPWGDGVVAIGGSGETGWLVKFDRSGQSEWQKRGPSYFGDEAIEMANHDLVVVHHVRDSTIVRLNVRGDVLASCSVPGEAHIIHPLGPATDLHVYVLDPSLGPVKYLAFDRSLKVASNSPSGMFGATKAYEKADGSMVLFGGTGGANTTAAVGRRFPGIQGIRGYTVSPPHQSGWFIDAVPTTAQPGEFVAIRTIVSFYPGSPGWPNKPEGEFFGNRLVLAWISIGAAVPTH